MLNARGDPFLGLGPILGVAGKVLGKGIKLLKGGKAKKAVQAVVGAVKKVAGKKATQQVALGGGAAAATELLLRRKGAGVGMVGGRRRSMNAGNVKALRRSMRRVEAFATLAKKTIAFTKATRMKSTKKGGRCA